jgi:hypothetical protein
VALAGDRGECLLSRPTSFPITRQPHACHVEVASCKGYVSGCRYLEVQIFRDSVLMIHSQGVSHDYPIPQAREDLSLYIVLLYIKVSKCTQDT